MLVFYDDDIREGRVELYSWQVKMLKEFGDSKLLETRDINRMALVAGNGSGKSKYILAPCIVWLPTMFDYGFSYVTSASAQQLDTQTERYVDFLIDKMNIVHREQFGGEVWKKIKRKKNYFPTNGFIDLLATDEGEKAEGKHPLGDKTAFGVFKDESKAISEEIHAALDRCKGYSHILEVSSTGGCRGRFYEINTRPELQFKVHKVTSLDCPHIDKKEIELDIIHHGISSPLVRSMHFAEFTSFEDKTVIDREAYYACARLWLDKYILHFGEHSGLDLSAGGDEFVLSVFKGNVQVALETGRYKNTSLETDEIIHWIQKYNLNPLKIWADDGGIGRGIIDNLHRLGYKVNRRMNQWKALDSTRYANRGTEDWFNFKRFIEEVQVKLLEDNLQREQLVNRFYKQQDSSGRIILESKEQARANGHPSPDRADATVLAWCEYRFPLDINKYTEGLKNKNNIIHNDELPLLFHQLRRFNNGLNILAFSSQQSLGGENSVEIVSDSDSPMASPADNHYSRVVPLDPRLEIFLPISRRSKNRGSATTICSQADVIDKMGVGDSLDYPAYKRKY